VPGAELEPHLPIHPERRESKALVECDAPGVRKGDARDGAVKALEVEDPEERGVEAGADAASALVCCDVGRDLDGPAIGGPRSMGSISKEMAVSRTIGA
jgi:hypothetical protein